MGRKLKKLTRRKDGSFKNFRGGRDSTHHGKQVKRGKEFKKQHGRRAKPGDIIRQRNKDGSYDKRSTWAVYTEHGWRTTSKTKKPTRSQVKSILKKSRPGR